MPTNNADLRSAELIKRLHGIDYPSVAEIGVYDGEMSRRLLYRVNLHLLMVDTWGSVPVPDDAFYEAWEDHDWAKVQASAIGNVSWAADRVRIFQGTSDEALDEFPDDKFDCVFIDASHDYESVSNDLDSWWERVAEGGWLGGHDYGRKEFGVTQAVDEFCEANGLDLEVGENFTYWIKKC